MNTKKGKIVWFLYVVLLVFLFLASSTDLIIKEKKNEIFPISVVIEDTDDADYVNFRKGMELAASELNADVSFITLYDKNDLEQQRALMEREQQDSAGALIVSPVNEERHFRKPPEYPCCSSEHPAGDFLCGLCGSAGLCGNGTASGRTDCSLP